ncbi:GNAT family N-acetyltransferase [Streptomyces cavernae]|uniref:GNAT family N-acetyltransferase n=1 Tax=Streptomyces cavernae TaxID=2259034 RepID=UPI000FEB6C76|nr:GNAT family N-acetyltransferase [Streptomyces cavernae]
MPPNDASTDAGTVSVAAPGPGPGPCVADSCPDNEDTLELRLPAECIALPDTDEAGPAAHRPTPADEGAPPPAVRPHPAADHARTPPRNPDRPLGEPYLPVADRPASIGALLDHPADWGPISTPVGTFHLRPVSLPLDLPLVSRWMNDPAVAAFWSLAGDAAVTEAHLRAQLGGDGRSLPCMGMLDGKPMSFWEIYRADLDPLARHYPVRPHDTGIHLLIGGVADRGRGLGSTLLRAVADLALDRRPSCARVIAEPDLRNTPSISAFLTAGFRFSAEVDLPGKRAALMVRDRALRDLL